jgi:hypothetical protein
MDAQMAEGLGTACTRADERMAASIGLIRSAATRFERCLDVPMGGVLAGLPALCGNGLLGGLGRHLSLPGGFYGALHVPSDDRNGAPNRDHHDGPDALQTGRRGPDVLQTVPGKLFGIRKSELEY